MNYTLDELLMSRTVQPQEESLAIAEQHTDREFAARQAEVMEEIAAFDDMEYVDEDYDYSHECGYCGSSHCHGGCQLGGLG